MFGVIFNCIAVIGVFSMVFISPVCMSIGLVRLSNDNFKISKSERAKCMIPIYNYFYASNKYYGNPISIAGISTIILIISVIIRLVVMFLFYYDNNVQTITIYLFLVACLLFWVCQAGTIYKILSDSGVYTFGGKLINAVTVIIGHIQVGYWLPRKMYYYTQKKGNKESLYERD